MNKYDFKKLSDNRSNVEPKYSFKAICEVEKKATPINQKTRVLKELKK